MSRVRPAILWMVTTAAALMLSACCSATPTNADPEPAAAGDGTLFFNEGQATDRPAQPDPDNPWAPPATIVLAADDTEVREVPGKASITFLARGHNAFIGRLEMEPGGKVPVHRDATEEYIHVLEGHGTMWIDGTPYDIQPGTTVFMPANAEVRYENGDQRLVAIQVFAGPAPATKYDAEAWKVVRQAAGASDDSGGSGGSGE